MAGPSGEAKTTSESDLANLWASRRGGHFRDRIYLPAGPNLVSESTRADGRRRR